MYPYLTNINICHFQSSLSILDRYPCWALPAESYNGQGPDPMRLRLRIGLRWLNNRNRFLRTALDQVFTFINILWKQANKLPGPMRLWLSTWIEMFELPGKILKRRPGQWIAGSIEIMIEHRIEMLKWLEPNLDQVFMFFKLRGQWIAGCDGIKIEHGWDWDWEWDGQVKLLGVHVSYVGIG